MPPPDEAYRDVSQLCAHIQLNNLTKYEFKNIANDSNYSNEKQSLKWLAFPNAPPLGWVCNAHRINLNNVGFTLGKAFWKMLILKASPQ
ncbi:MAG: hypothetical protein V7K64_20300 [Nostoc sp.]|uniref:hypothetical protein n=1 Tax=unclassified Nostoc TaxID=2593658 RepID=UPI001DF20E76|nr:hypothetical protein [Nostoc sp. JL34]MBN3883619.1 hypothetical protein [Nostoc sp. JL34]